MKNNSQNQETKPVATEETTTTETTPAETSQTETSQETEKETGFSLSEMIVGTWVSDKPVTEFTFKKSGKCHMESENESVDGRYKIKGNMLYLDSGVNYKISIKNGTLTMKADFGTFKYTRVVQ